jgi:hypothetical protein
MVLRPKLRSKSPFILPRFLQLIHILHLLVLAHLSWSQLVSMDRFLGKLESFQSGAKSKDRVGPVG